MRRPNAAERRETMSDLKGPKVPALRPANVLDEARAVLDSCVADCRAASAALERASAEEDRTHALWIAAFEAYAIALVAQGGHEPPNGDDDDPTPWCAVCGAKTPDRCDCGPRAAND